MKLSLRIVTWPGGSTNLSLHKCHRGEDIETIALPTYASTMSATEIVEELDKLTPEELEIVYRRAVEFAPRASC